jgi:hypothetical protein
VPMVNLFGLTLIDGVAVHVDNAEDSNKNDMPICKLKIPRLGIFNFTRNQKIFHTDLTAPDGDALLPFSCCNFRRK